MNNSNFNDFILYQEKLEIKDTTSTDTPKWANFLDLRLEFDEDGKLYIRLYDKCDEFDFPITNFPYLYSNIPESSAYAVLVSQLIFFSRKMKTFCSEDLFWFKVIEAGLFFTETSLKKGYSSRKLQTTFWKLYGRHTDLDLVHKFDTSASHMLKGLFTNCDT